MFDVLIGNSVLWCEESVLIALFVSIFSEVWFRETDSMVNLVKAQLTRQENTQYSFLLGLSDELKDDYLSTEFEDEQWIPFHCHSSRAACSQNHEKFVAQRKLLITCIICLVFMIGELIGGYIAHSLAIMTDAAHLLTDFGSILLSLFSLWISKKPPSKSLTYGWHRSEILGGLFSVLSIWVVTVVLVFIAIQRIISDDYEIHSNVMLITSGCAVVNGIYSTPVPSVSWSQP
ncbi:hypothetical protein PDJAM_G00016210 [Pangasius djambal]|uniref:Uncharacterized protein n=1 Tax=Pangasius djambal TaxID=1691987 RepID=A0ACC5YN36_9TELE|nr:hypothetical protein [Pangasius djambal]